MENPNFVTEEKKEELAQHSLRKANEYIKLSNFGRAFAHLLLHLELKPEGRISVENLFINVACLWSSNLEEQGDIDHAGYCLDQALRYFPENIQLLNSYGAYYERCGDYNRAIQYLQQAYNAAPHHLPTEKNLQSLYAKQIPQWHFRMLNDKSRNLIYKNAIELVINQVQEPVKILDVGAGTGILSLFAAKHCNQMGITNEIMAVEECPLMAQIAKEIIEMNNAKIQLMEVKSTNLDRKHFANLLITEIFDCSLFGEGVLSSLIHAHKHLLMDHGKVLPHSGKLMLFAIESPALYQQYSVQQTECLILPKCIRRQNVEPYDAFVINNYSYKKITNVAEVLKVNFNNLEDLEGLFLNRECIPEVFLDVQEDGILHAFVICFELILDPDGKFKLTNFPFDIDKDHFGECWEQGIVFSEHPIYLKKDTKIALNISVTYDELKIHCKHSTLPCQQEQCFEVSPQAISQLNFKELHSTYDKIIKKLETLPAYVLDLSAVPIFSFLLLKEASLLKHNIEIIANTETQNELLIKECKKLNKVAENQIRLLEKDKIFQLIDEGIRFDAIVYEPVQSNGLLNEQFFRNVDTYRNGLAENGMLLPQELQLCFQLVESVYLKKCTKALDKDLFGFQIAKSINKYSVDEMRNLPDIETTALSPIIKTFLKLVDKQEEELCVKITKNGQCNGFIYWFESIYMNECVSTLKSSYSQAAFASYNKHTDGQLVKINENVNIKVIQHNGLLKISFSNRTIK